MKQILDQVVIIAPLPAPRRRQRLAKMIPAYISSGISVKYRGWDRIRGEAKKWSWTESAIDEDTILTGGGHNTFLARAMYPLWMIRVFLFVLFFKNRQVFHCLGWETAFPATLAATVRGHKIIFDDADRFSMIVGIRGYLRSLIMTMEDWTASRAALHIIPSRSRHPKLLPTDFILPNTPTAQDIKATSSINVKKPAKFTIYVNGWLPETRGPLWIAESFHKFSKEKSDVSLLIAGFMPNEILDAMKGLDNIVYMGELPQADALALYKISDVLITFYDPSVEINRFAEPNKWGDAMSLGVPFIVNSEVETAKEYIDAGAAFKLPYGDVDGLVTLLSDLYSHPEKLKIATKNLLNLPGISLGFEYRFNEAIRLVFPKP